MLWIFIIFFLYYIYIRLSLGITRSNTCLIGKTALISGANSGLGYQTALNLAKRGCKIIMADVAEMEESKQNIIKYTNNTNIITKKVDFSSLQSVRDFASEIIKTEERLDILVNNAGISLSKESRTGDNLHPVMQINYFAHFLLTHLLIDLLKKSAPSRIVFSSSCMAFLGNLSTDNLNSNYDKNSMAKILSYCNSKLALLIASDIFAKKLKGTGVTSNSMHPGFVTTPIFGSAYGVLGRGAISFLTACYNKIYSKDAWEGSQTLVHLTVSKKLEKVTGKYFWDCRPFIKPFRAHNKKLCKSIWDASEKLVQLKPDERL